MTLKGSDPGIVAVAEVLLCSSVPTQLLIGALLSLAGWLPIDETGQLSLAFVLVLSVADTLLLIGLMVALTRAHGERVADLWLGHRRVTPEALYGARLIPVVFLVVVVVLSVLRIAAPWLHDVPTNPLEQLAGHPRAGGRVRGGRGPRGRRAGGDATRFPASSLRTAPRWRGALAW